MSRESNSTVMGRFAVEWFVPGTRIGDGRPLNGVRFVDAASPGEAWDRFNNRVEPIGEVVLRVVPAEDLPSLPRLRHIMDSIGIGVQ
jgi:hypothetical protein